MTTEVQCTWRGTEIGPVVYASAVGCSLPVDHDGPHVVDGVGYITPDSRLPSGGLHPDELIVDEVSGLTPSVEWTARDMPDEHPLFRHGGSVGSVTVDSLLRSPARPRARTVAGQRAAFDALFPPQPAATGWKRARQWLGDRVSNARTRLALTIAPWLEIR